MNETEQFVYKVCQKTFLSLWSYANPRGKKSKELCDVLIVSEPNIIVISVKNIQITDTGDEETDIKRWWKKAIDKSVKQIYGAERWLRTSTYVIKSDGSRGLQLPPKSKRKYYRISVSLGSQGKAPILSGDYGKGNVRVFDEKSFSIILQELNTVSDFIQYLEALEKFSEDGGQFWVNSGGEEDLLGYYLMNNRQFDNASLLLIDDDMWINFLSSPEYKRKIEADRVSYAWDNLIEIIANEVPEYVKAGVKLEDIELLIRIMSLELRFSRRMLGKHFVEFLGSKEYRSRILPSAMQPDTTYVILNSYDENRQHVIAELNTRCFVARGLSQSATKIIGIAVYQSELRSGFAIDLVYLDKTDWLDTDENVKQEIQEKFGFFVDTIQTNVSDDEYPKD